MLRLLIWNFQNKPVSIIFEVTNIFHREQMSIVVRYFNGDTFNTIEIFVGLQWLQFTDAQLIFNELSAVVNSLKN